MRLFQRLPLTKCCVFPPGNWRAYLSFRARPSLPGFFIFHISFELFPWFFKHPHLLQPPSNPIPKALRESSISWSTGHLLRMYSFFFNPCLEPNARNKDTQEPCIYCWTMYAMRCESCQLACEMCVICVYLSASRRPYVRLTRLRNPALERRQMGPPIRVRYRCRSWPLTISN